MQATSLWKAYHYCEQIARNHYENFPVASRLLPRRLRRPITVIYAFARSADDFADEGELTDDERLAKLREYGQKLEHLHRQKEDPLFIALAAVVSQYKLDLQPFHDLLTAFSMDVTKKRYTGFSSVLFYCRHSANPIGRLLLDLFGETSNEAREYADAVCTALQLINFYQDLARDFDEHKRIYIPTDEMAQYGIKVDHFRDKNSDPDMVRLMEFQISRARQMLLSGYPLGRILSGRPGFEIRMVMEAGLTICHKLMNHNNNVFARPRLNSSDWPGILWRALWPRSTPEPVPTP